MAAYKTSLKCYFNKKVVASKLGQEVGSSFLIKSFDVHVLKR